MVSAKDLITENNVIDTYNQGKYIVFVLESGIKVKLNPNEYKGDGINVVKKEEK